jgi:hypothetical protein
MPINYNLKVSDPKLYNPKIVKARVPPSRALKPSPTSGGKPITENGINNGVNNYNPTPQPPPQHTSPL